MTGEITLSGKVLEIGLEIGLTIAKMYAIIIV